MKILKFTFLIFLVLSLSSCKKILDSLSTPQSVYKGTWKIQSYSYSGNQTDSLIVSLNMDGNNNALSGTGDINYYSISSNVSNKVQFTGSITGTYDSTHVAITVNGISSSIRFTYFGTEKTSGSPSSYIGTATVISPADTAVLTQQNLFKSSQ